MESVEVLNQRLIDYFGLDTNTGQPMFRIVWADDQLEKRLVQRTEAGIEFIFPEIMEVKKYSYLPHMYVLEQLVIIPEVQKKEIPGKNLSYEPLWAFKDKDNNPLPPIWTATKFVIDTLHAAMGKKSMRKYVDSELNTTVEGKDQRVKELAAELFGNETQTTDALAYKEGVVVPSTYEKVN